jgi:hypothetical protein
MKYASKFLGVAIISLALVGGFFLHQVLAATGTLYVSPATTSVKNGSNFTASIRLNPGTAVDTVSAVLTYDTAKLTYVSINYSGSPFTTQLPKIESGRIQVDSALLGGTVSTDSLVANVTFTAKVGSGSSSLGLTGNAVNGGTTTNPAVTGGTVNFTTPPPATTPPPPPPTTTTKPPTTTTKPPTSTPPTTTPPTSTPALNPPAIKDVKVQYSTAAVSATTASPVSLYARYGLTDDNLSTQTAATPLGTAHTVVFDPSNLVPGVTYYYVVYAKDAQGKEAHTDVQSFTTKGLTVTVGVFDKNHVPIKGKTVTLHSSPQSGKTDKNGFVTFKNVAAGNHDLEYKAGSKTYSEQLQVANNVSTAEGVQTAPTQTVSIVFDFVQRSSFLTSPWLLGVLLLVVVVAVFMVLRRRDRFDYNLASAANNYQGEQPVTVSGDNITERLKKLPDTPPAPPGNMISPTDSKTDKEL